MALLKYSLKTNIIKSIFYEIVSNVSSYYYCYGKSEPWATVLDPVTNVIISDENIIEAVVDSSNYESQVRENISYMKLVSSNDAAIVIRRVNWVGGTVYDMFDTYSESHKSTSGKANLSECTFYVLTPDYNVYKCLFNANGAASTVQPTGFSVNKFKTYDGYIWKFMYTIPLYLREKFLTPVWMPVTTSVNSQFYSKGKIIDYIIEDSGDKYEKNTWKVKGINVTNPGVNYTNGDLITFDVSPDVTAQGILIVNNEIGSVDSITVSNSGSGYITIPDSTLNSATGSNLDYAVEFMPGTTTEGSQWTELIVTGDGFNENNPYSLKLTRIEPLEGQRGNFTVQDVSPSTFIWPKPKTSYGYIPIVVPVYREISGNDGHYEIDYIDVINPGYGYTVPLVFGGNVSSTLTGFSCELGTKETQKNEATLLPIIGSNKQIQGIMVLDGGIGYTYANVDAKLYKIVSGIKTEIEEGVTSGPTYKSGFRKARITLKFNVGDLQTKQSGVELVAVNGSVPIVKVLDGGSGYSYDDPITIIGDGKNFNATLSIGTGGSITGVNVTNEGSGYKNIRLLVGAINNGNPINDSVVFYPIISPNGGHGKDAVTELYANTIMFTSRVGLEYIHGVYFSDPLNFRQLSLIKNPIKTNSNIFYRNISGSTTALLTCDIDQALA